MMKMYGSIQNRLEENRQFVPEIVVGTGMTEYLYSDCRPYEVVEVKDQKHVAVRPLDHKHVGYAYTNEWELISNPNNPTYQMTKRGKYWYWTVTITPDMVDDSIDTILFLAHNGTSADEVISKGKVTKYHRANVSFGVAQYYYDYSF